MAHRIKIRNSGVWSCSRGCDWAAVTVVVGVGVLVAVVETAVDRALALAGRAVLAEARRDAAFHEPDGVLDKLHWRAEDPVRRTVEVRVCAWVGRVAVVARQMHPERVALWETDELPGYPECRSWRVASEF